MTDTKNVEPIFSLDLNSKNFWAINVHSDTGVPAVEVDITTGKQVVLLWTSRELALKYCYLRSPGAVENLYQLVRQSKKDAAGNVVVTQIGLLKIARRILVSRMSEITHFVIDHPGTRGPALYLSVEEMAYIGRKPPVAASLSTNTDLTGFLDSVTDE